MSWLSRLAALAALMVPAAAVAQSQYPSPTFQNVTVLNNLTFQNLAVTGTASIVGQTTTKNLNLGNNQTITWSGSAQFSTALTPFYVSNTFNGTSTATSPVMLNRIGTEQDNIHGPLTVPINNLQVNHRFGGANTVGSRQTFVVAGHQNAATGDAAIGNDPTYVAAFFGEQADFNVGGTDTSIVNSRGHVFASNPQALLFPGATFYNHIAGEEINVATVNDVAYRSGLSVVGSAGAGKGQEVDALIWLYNGLSATPWTNGILFGGPTSVWAFDANSSLIGMTTSATVAPQVAKWGMDFNGAQFPATGSSYDGGFLRSAGFAVDGAGRTRIGTTFLTPSATGLAIDAIGSVGTVVTGAVPINAGGSGYTNGVANDVVRDLYGGIYLVDVTAGVVTGINTVVRQPVWPNHTTAPATSVTTTLGTQTGGPGSGLILNLTWNTTATTLALQPGGGAITVGGALTFGVAPANRLTITPGAASTNPIALAQSGTGGVTLNAPLTFLISTLGPGLTALKVGNQQTMPAGALSPIQMNAVNLAGVITGGGNTSTLNMFQTASDTADASGTAGVSLVQLLQQFGGAGTKGGRVGLKVLSKIIGAISDTNQFYTGVVSNIDAQFSAGGTAPTLTAGLGSVFAFNPTVTLETPATNYLEASLSEWNMAVKAGASVARKFGIKITLGANDAVQGAVADAAFKFGGQGGLTAGWKNAILFGGDVSEWTVPGNLLKTEYGAFQASTPNTSVWGVDFLEDLFPAFAANGGFLRSQGFSVDGVGVTQIGTTLLSPTATGLSIDPTGSVATATTLSAAGANCAVGDILLFGNNGRAVVLTSGGPVATYSVLNYPYDFSGAAPATLAATAYPSSPGPCTGVVFGITWSTRDGVQISSAGRKVGLYGATAVVRASGYAAMTGTPNKAAVYDTTTVTLPQLAGRIMQLQADLAALGAIGN